MSQYAVVAGGGMGIGEAIVRRLHADGWTVTIVDRVAAMADAVANDLGERAHAECADITRPEQIAAVMDVVKARAGGAGVGAAVNAVGVYDERRPLLKTDLASYQRIMNVNVMGAFIFSQGIEPLLAANASVVHIGSVNGILAGTHIGAYKVSKAAMNMLARCMASELARDPRRIRVNVVAPGWVDTPGERKVQAALGQPNILDDPNAFKNIPMQRLTKASEIADTVAFLCSARASGITGQIVHVDCGIANSEI
jgi:NAD(P)-dependent dehydrogenase (short-subunit alcohol dehydrogenase family)